MSLRPLHILLTTACLVAPLVAQDDGEKHSPTLQELQKDRVLEEGGDLEKVEAENTGPRGGLRNHMTMVVAMKPRRMAPGSQGTMQLILAMRNETVLLPGSHLNLILPDRLGPLVPGAWRLQEPGLGKLETAFRGQPVYDNTAVIDVDVGVMADATYGQHRFSFRVEAEVTDGPTGSARGVFMDVVNGQIEVGDPLPTPVVMAGPESGDAPDGGEAADPLPSDAASGVAAQDGGPRAVAPAGGRVADPVRSAEEAQPGSSTSGSGIPAGAEEGMPLFLVIGGGVLLLLIGLLVVFRGR